MGVQVHKLGQELFMFQPFLVPQRGIEQDEDCEEHDKLLRAEQTECV